MAKSLVLSVSIKPGCYRHIQIGENATLYELSSAILNSFDFDDDHLHSFFMNNQPWDEDYEYSSPHGDSSCGFTDEVKLSEFHLQKGSKFLYIFDYGDDWRFHISVLHVVDEPTKNCIELKRVGEVCQYGYEDEYEDEDEDE
jgi:hypothetical protein